MTPTHATTTANTSNSKVVTSTRRQGNPSPAPSNNVLLEQWRNPDHWRKLCPRLHISDGPTAKATRREDGHAAVPTFDNDRRHKLLKTRLVRDGYALLNRPLASPSLLTNIARSISDLELRRDLPATFVLLFDESWELASASCESLMPRHYRQTGDAIDRRGGILHPRLKFNYDVLAWHVDPSRNQAGFSPHRDRQPPTREALRRSFYEGEEGDGGEGEAKYVTHWVALSDATAENSCLYVIPKGFDPGYLGGDDDFDDDDHDDGDDTERFSDPLARALPTKQSYQNIRALPRQAGQSVVFTHRILHWGSRGNPHPMDLEHDEHDAHSPRIAISFVYSDEEFEAPYIREDWFKKCEGVEDEVMPDAQGDGKGNRSSATSWNYPPFSIRLLLVCAQLLIYHQRFQLSAPMLRACYEYCKLHSNDLNEVYRKKVFVEFVKAMKEQNGENVPPCEKEDRDFGSNDIATGDKSDTNNFGTPDNDGVYSDDEEAILEEMLNHQEEFDDDFDDMECCDYAHSAGDDSSGHGTKSKSESHAKVENNLDLRRKKRRIW
ncbi:hypothetical protein ACHAXS_013096 [Conticribra weissflogii]